MKPLVTRWIKTVYTILVDTVRHFIDDEGLSIAAEASFYLMFSLFPLLFILVAFIGWVSVGSASWFDTFYRVTAAFVPDVTRDMMSGTLQGLADQFSGKEVLLAVVIFTLPASNVFYVFSAAVNKAYNAPNSRSYLRYRIVSLFLLFASGTFIFLTAGLFSLIPVLSNSLALGSMVHWSPLVLQAVRYLGAFVILTPAIALIYRYGPVVENPADHIIWPGAVLSSGLWLFFSELFGLYIRYLDTYRVIYGTLGGIMLLMLWMYLVSTAVIIGAEFNQAWRKRS